MTAQQRRKLQRFLCSIIPAALAGALTIGGPAALAATAKSKKVQTSKAGKSTGKKTTKTAARSSGKVLQSGKASWYGPGFHGRKTANGERFNMYELTAAHKTLPLGTRIKVLNPANGKEVVVRINDRGPYAHGRILDLSKAAASQLGLINRGHGDVVLHALGEHTDSTGLRSTALASADVPAPIAPMPGYSRHQTQMLALTLAQTRFGDSRLALGNPPPSEPLPNWPVNDALTGLPVMASIGSLTSPTHNSHTGLSLPSWMRWDADTPPRLAVIPSFEVVNMAPTTTVARALNKAQGAAKHRGIDEAKLVSVSHTPTMTSKSSAPPLRMNKPIKASKTRVKRNRP